MKWISVDDSLPVIPEGRYGVEVLIVEHDPVYEEINPGHGSDTSHAMYMKNIPGYPDAEPDFQIMLLGGQKPHVSWTYSCDEITHWMYLPEPIQKVN